VNIFKAFDLTPWDEVKVVILWQDPYHGPGQAMGLSFSVPEELPLPPSLKNIYKELHQEWFEHYQSWSPLIHNGKISWDLTRRAEQWVLLLNSILTVRAGEAASHSKIWRQHFTDEVIRQISTQKSWIVFMLRWNYAISKSPLIDEKKHLILKGVHPSPLSASRGRFGCNHFTLCNDYLTLQGEKPIQR
jgi:uracil-DNA glycosylase